VEQARERVAELIGAAAGDIVFTSGGTEACQLALRDRGGPVVTTGMEHPAVLGALADRARLVAVDGRGRVDPGAIADALNGAAACSVQWANHEVGNQNAMAEIAARCRSAGVPLHTDAVQAAGKVPVEVGVVGVDLLSLSAHKLGGPMGVGALYARPGLLRDTSSRGGQERGRRPGSENVIGIVGMGAACEAAAARIGARQAMLVRLTERLEAGLKALDAVIHGDGPARVPGTTNFSLAGVPGDALVQALDLEGIRVSTGAACTSASIGPSPVMRAMGLGETEARGAVRVSLGSDTTAAEIDRLLELLPLLTKRIRAHDPAP
jgi:cysteine desulfurase